MKRVAEKGRKSGGWPSVVAVIVNYNGASSIYKSKPVFMHSVKSLERIKYPSFSVVMTDDSSTDNSVEYMRKNFPNVETVVSKPNGGFAKAANRGLAYAIRRHDPDYLLLMCNGVIVTDPDWLRKMVDVAESEKDIGIVGCKYLYPDGTLQEAGYRRVGPITRTRSRDLSALEQGEKKRYGGIEEVEAVSGAVHLIKRKVIDRIGLRDENYYMGSDDIDYCMMARKAGFKVMYDGEVSVIHLEGYSFKHTAVNEKKDKDFWFPTLQINYAYSAFKHFNTLDRAKVILVMIASSFVGIGTRQMKLTSVRLKNRIPWRLKASLNGIVKGYRLYKRQISKKEAYGLKR